MEGEVSGKANYRKTAIGPVAISDVSPEGKYIILENLSPGKNREAVNLDGWKLMSVDQTRRCTYYFRNFKLEPGKIVKIWASAYASEAGMNDLLFRDEDTWVVGPQVTTTLLNDKDEEMATYVKTTV